jgi:glutamine phosphoribosylpyrophosphate amidotransferase
MHKYYFHNGKLTNENKSKKKLPQSLNIDIKSVVDINILLNKVKIEEKNQIKRKIIFFSLVTTILILFGTFITFLK